MGNILQTDEKTIIFFQGNAFGNVVFSFKFSLKFVPQGTINSAKSSLFQVLADLTGSQDWPIWADLTRSPGWPILADSTIIELNEPMMTPFTDDFLGFIGWSAYWWVSARKT